MNRKMIQIYYTCFFIIFVLIKAFNCFALSENPWVPDKNECSQLGIYLGHQKDIVFIHTDSELVTYPFNQKSLFALKGPTTGKIIKITNFPHNIPVEIIINSQGIIRAMYNQIEQLDFAPYIKLNNRGHLATLSPKGTDYTIFHCQYGLFLQDLAQKKKPVFLTSQYPCAWNNRGTKIALVQEKSLGIYDLQQNHKEIFPFPNNNQNLVQVIFSIAWSPQDNRLFYTYLEDYPQCGSDIFYLLIINEQGQELNKKLLPNLGPSCWLSNEKIIYVLNPTPERKGKIVIWDIVTNKTTILIGDLTDNCDNLCYNSVTKTIAYTLTKEETNIEELYLHNLPQSQTNKIKTLVFPLTNLQWLSANHLIWGDEINNTINIIGIKNGEITKFKGYLPAKCTTNGFLYFPQKPSEEPLPLYFSSTLNLEMFN